MTFEKARAALSALESAIDDIEVEKPKPNFPSSDVLELTMFWHATAWEICSSLSPENEVDVPSFEHFRQNLPRGVYYQSYPLKLALDVLRRVVSGQPGSGSVEDKVSDAINCWFDADLGHEFYEEFFRSPPSFTAIRVEIDPVEGMFPSMIQLNPSQDMDWGNVLGEVANSVVSMMDYTRRLTGSREHAREMLLLAFAKQLAVGNEEDEMNASAGEPNDADY